MRFFCDNYHWYWNQSDRPIHFKHKNFSEQIVESKCAFFERLYLTTLILYHIIIGYEEKTQEG